MEVRNSNLANFIEMFTSNMCLMVMSDPSITSAATLVNILNVEFAMPGNTMRSWREVTRELMVPGTTSICIEYCQMLCLKMLSHLFSTSFKKYNVIRLKVGLCAAYFHVGSYLGLSEPSWEMESPNKVHQTEAVVVEECSCCENNEKAGREEEK